MSACAGSLTRASDPFGPGADIKFAPCLPLDSPGEQEHYFQAFRRPGPDGSRPQDWFMSTQRRDNRNTQRPAIVAGTPVPQGFWPQDWRGIFGAQLRSRSAIRSCPHPRPNGDRSLRHKLSAIGFPQHSTSFGWSLGTAAAVPGPWGHSTRSAATFALELVFRPSASLPAPCVSISPCRVYR